MKKKQTFEKTIVFLPQKSAWNMQTTWNMSIVKKICNSEAKAGIWVGPFPPISNFSSGTGQIPHPPTIIFSVFKDRILWSKPKLQIFRTCGNISIADEQINQFLQILANLAENTSFFEIVSVMAISSLFIRMSPSLRKSWPMIWIVWKNPNSHFKLWKGGGCTICRQSVETKASRQRPVHRGCEGPPR